MSSSSTTEYEKTISEMAAMVSKILSAGTDGLKQEQLNLLEGLRRNVNDQLNSIDLDRIRDATAQSSSK